MGRRWLLWFSGLALVFAGSLAVAGDKAAPAAAGGDAKITMYVAPQCGYCEKARELLTQHKVQWQERDILASAEAKADWQKLGGRGTPVLVIGSDVIHGLDPARIDTALAARAP
jgi:mycoredoxin